MYNASPSFTTMAPGGASSSTDDSPEARTNFLLFIKVLFQLLKRTGDELLMEQAKLIVYRCQVESPSQSSMRQAVGKELEELVGGYLWAQAKQYTVAFLHKKQREMQQQQQQHQQQLMQQRQPTPLPVNTKGDLLDDDALDFSQFGDLLQMGSDFQDGPSMGGDPSMDNLFPL
eukprot:Nitzschia sp. Nitz4//scaffold225_size51843//36672//37190//NITZ4_006901-RA/size51843-processed-gene-0.75-mRNA-1//-1//CDS//3329542693//2281//frame0